MDETTNLSKGAAFVYISSKDKQRIYQQWARALIVKVYGKNVGFKLLYRKLHELWKPNKELTLIDLGHDFFLIDFKHHENYSKTLHDSLLFISGHFLAVRQ